MSNSPSKRKNSSNASNGAEIDEEKNKSRNHFQNYNSHVSRSYISSLPDAKWIHIYLNGDEHFSGCRCVVNYRHYRNLDMFLNYLTERLKPSFGALRNIYTPVNGHPVLKLEDLVSKHKYVVAGNERFKKLEFGYTDAVDRRLRRNGVIPKSNFKISKAKSLSYKVLNVYLYQNGNLKGKSYKIILYSQDLESWELVFKKITESIKCGPIKRLYSLNGKPIQNIEELINNQSYIVIGKHEDFKYGQYGTVSENSSSNSKIKTIPNHTPRKSSSVITTRSSALYSRLSTKVSKNYGQIHDPYSIDKRSSEQNQHSAHSLNIKDKGNGLESDSFNPIEEKETCLYRRKAKINLDDDYSGLFRSKHRNDLTEGALEIEDSLETIIDIPVDLLEAEEVEDEITPDMERSMQHLSLDVSEKIVAYLPSIQDKTNSDERHVSANKYNLNQSQTIDIHNVYA